MIIVLVAFTENEVLNKGDERIDELQLIVSNHPSRHVTISND